MLAGSDDLFKYIAEEWERLPAVDRVIYDKMAREDEERYEKELIIFQLAPAFKRFDSASSSAVAEDEIGVDFEAVASHVRIEIARIYRLVENQLANSVQRGCRKLSMQEMIEHQHAALMSNRMFYKLKDLALCHKAVMHGVGRSVVLPSCYEFASTLEALNKWLKPVASPNPGPCLFETWLPLEVQALIVRLCNIATRAALGAASKYFNGMVITPSVWRRILFVRSTGFHMTDEHLARLLTKVDARNVTERLVLRNCPMVTGWGLWPLRESTTLRILDLRCADLMVPILRQPESIAPCPSMAASDIELIVRQLRTRKQGPPLELTIFNTILDNNLRDLREEWVQCRINKMATLMANRCVTTLGEARGEASDLQLTPWHPCTECEDAFRGTNQLAVAIADMCLFCEGQCCPGVAPLDTALVPKVHVGSLGDTAKRARLGRHSHKCANPPLRCVTCTQVACKACEVKSGFTFQACDVCGGRVCNICRSTTTSCRSVAMFMRCKLCKQMMCRPCSLPLSLIGVGQDTQFELMHRGIHRVCRDCQTRLLAENESDDEDVALGALPFVP